MLRRKIMNERIKLIMLEAGYAAPEIALRAQKLVEMVVLECAEIADIEKPNSVGCGYITKTNGMRIKEHFFWRSVNNE